MTPIHVGRQQLYKEVPFTAVFGLQRREKSLTQAFADSAAKLDAYSRNLSLEESTDHISRTSMVLCEELEFESHVVTLPLVLAVTVSAASQFLFGYNTGAMNPPESVVFPGHSTLDWSLAVSAFCLGGPVGAFLAGQFADEKGRKWALLLDAWIYVIGGLLQVFSWNMTIMAVARFIIGVGSGFGSVLVPIYLGELAPPILRGVLGTGTYYNRSDVIYCELRRVDPCHDALTLLFAAVTQIALVVGILAADFLAFPFTMENNWRLLFAVTPVVGIFQLVMSPFVLESPRWLLSRNPDSLRARYIVKNLRGFRTDMEVEDEVGHILTGGHKHGDDQGNNCNKSATMVEMLSEIWENDKLRLLLISSFVLHAGQQLSGCNAVFYYSTLFFEGVVDKPLVGTTAVGAVNVVATLLSIPLMNHFKRRSLVMLSSVGMLVSCIVITMGLVGVLGKLCALLAVNTFIMFFEFGLGPLPWLFVAESFDGKYAAVAMAVSSQLNWICNFAIGFVFPFVNKALGPYSFLPFVGILMGVIIFAEIIMPDEPDSTPEAEADGMTRRLSSDLEFRPSSQSTDHFNEEWRRILDQVLNEEESERRGEIVRTRTCLGK